MPQASEELRKAWGGRDGVGEDKAISHLEAQGYRLTSRWNWLIPEGRQVSEQDIGAASFLVEEWDWGWFVENLSPGEMAR